MRDSLSLPNASARLVRLSWLLPVLIAVALIASLFWLLTAWNLTDGWVATVADPARALGNFTTVFLGIFIEAVPFILLGVVVSSALHLFVSEERLSRLAPHHPVPASLSGALLGMIFPVCECGVVPVSRRLMQKGASLPLGVAFLLAAPVINPIVIASTWVAFNDWRMVAWRVGLTLVIAAGIGLVFAAHPQPRALLREERGDGDACCPPSQPHHHRALGPGERARAVLWHSGGEFVEMSRYLILGALLAAGVQTVVPRAALLTLGDTPISSVLVMIGLGALLSICSTVDAFIALSFAGAFSTGSVLAFLVFGPMIDIKATLMFLSVFRRRAVAVIVLLTFQAVLLAALFINFTWG